MAGRRIWPWVAILLGMLMVAGEAGAQSYAADLNALAASNSLTGANQTFSRDAANALVPGMGSQSATIPGYGVSTPQEMAQRGAERLALCKIQEQTNTLSDQEKAQCEAAKAAAGIATEREQYSLVPDATADWTRELNRTSRERAKLNPTLNGNVPTYTITGGDCVTRQQVLDMGSIPQSCWKRHDWWDELCTETLTVEVIVSYSVSRGGEILATDVSEAEAQQLVAENPGATTSKKVKTKDVWSDECKLLLSNQLCDRDGKQCLLGPAVQTINGERIERECWKQKRGFTCYSPKPVEDTCEGWRESGCVPSAVHCALNRLENGDCMDISYTMACPLPGVQYNETECTGDKLCFGDQCYDISKRKDQDFATAIAYLEAGREGGVYADTTSCASAAPTSGICRFFPNYPGCAPVATNCSPRVRLFAGQMGSCTRPVGPGIGKNCCKSLGGAVNDHSVMSGGLSPTNILGEVVISTALGNATSIGSHYAYDFMFSNDFFSEKAWTAIADGRWNPDAAFMDLLQGPSLSMYGFTLGPASAVGGGILGANVTLITDVFPGYNLSFNPYVLALTITLQVISELFSCTMEEQLLGMRRGGNLCQHFGTRCTARLPKPLNTCIQETEDWCCWNSKLAMAIAQQVKPHDCNGFTPEEFAQVDFSKVDLSVFTNEIKATASQYEHVATPEVVNTLQERVVTRPTGQMVGNGARSTLPPAATVNPH